MESSQQSIAASAMADIVEEGMSCGLLPSPPFFLYLWLGVRVKTTLNPSLGAASNVGDR
jgi:hypothetical protein